MKRPLLIILGIILVLILLGIWVYVLLTGNQSNSDRFAEFGFGDTTDSTVQEPIVEQEPVVNVAKNKALRQLTTKPVAGFTEVLATASSTAYVQYVESGTGHIYKIDLESGVEERISATTIPVTIRAALTPNGLHTIIQAGEGNGTEFIVGTIATTSDELSNFALKENITSFATSDENEILYTAASGNNTLAKAYNPRTNVSRVLFTIPFRDVAIDWYHKASGPHLVYPKAASRLEGFVYSYTNGVLSRLPLSGFGISAAGSDENVLSSEVNSKGEYFTTNYSYTTGQVSQLPITVIPEKCTGGKSNGARMVCGASLVEYSITMPNDWYTGELILSDSLWDIYGDSGSATLLSDIEFSSGRSVDVINPQFGGTDSALYFQNKLDQTLWMYDFTI